LIRGIQWQCRPLREQARSQACAHKVNEHLCGSWLAAIGRRYSSILLSNQLPAGPGG
jgi:hypothetical protein